MGKRMLITAFEPFGGEAVNTSAEVLRQLPDRIGGYEVEKAVLPVVFGKAAAQAIRRAGDAVFLLGEAGGRKTVTPETQARNIRNARIPDNEGNQPSEEAILPDGPERYETAVPVRKIAAEMREEGLEIAASEDAGTYVCNETFFLTGVSLTVPVCFIHVPRRTDHTEELAKTVQRFIELAVAD